MFVRDGYKVIKILSENEILINYGIENGAKVGRKIRIYSIGEEITDPDTGYLLGTLDTVKAELEIYQVYDSFSICRNIQREKRNILTPFAANFINESISYEKINVNKSDISPVNMPENSPVSVGDLVKIIA